MYPSEVGAEAEETVFIIVPDYSHSEIRSGDEETVQHLVSRVEDY
jgi:hypothetical protein